MRYCIVWCCKSKGTIQGVKYFRITKGRNAAWMQALRREALTSKEIASSKCICSLHFTPDDFYKNDDRKHLKSSAVPSLYLTPSSMNIRKELSCHKGYYKVATTSDSKDSSPDNEGYRDQRRFESDGNMPSTSGNIPKIDLRIVKSSEVAEDPLAVPPLSNTSMETDQPSTSNSDSVKCDVDIKSEPNMIYIPVCNTAEEDGTNLCTSNNIDSTNWNIEMKTEWEEDIDVEPVTITIGSRNGIVESIKTEDNPQCKNSDTIGRNTLFGFSFATMLIFPCCHEVVVNCVIW